MSQSCCAFCGQTNGTLLFPYSCSGKSCDFSRGVHLECLESYFIQKNSLACPSCQSLMGHEFLREHPIFGLHQAIQLKDIAMIQLYIQNIADPTEELYERAYLEAVKSGSVEVIQALLVQPCSDVLIKELIMESVKTSSPSMVSYLTDRYWDLLEPRDVYAALCLLPHEQDIVEVLLDDSKVDTDYVIRIICEHGNVDVLKLILASDRGSYAREAMEQTIIHNKPEFIVILVGDNHIKLSDYWLQEVGMSGHIEMIEELLKYVSKEKDLFIEDPLCCALWTAARSGHIHVLEHFKDRPEMRQLLASSDTIDRACAFDKEAGIRWLIKHGVKYSTTRLLEKLASFASLDLLKLASRGEEDFDHGGVCLERAAKRADLEILNWFLQLNAYTKEKVSEALIASRSASVMAALLNKGADPTARGGQAFISAAESDEAIECLNLLVNSMKPRDKAEVSTKALEVVLSKGFNEVALQLLTRISKVTLECLLTIIRAGDDVETFLAFLNKCDSVEAEKLAVQAAHRERPRILKGIKALYPDVPYGPGSKAYREAKKVRADDAIMAFLDNFPSVDEDGEPRGLSVPAPIQKNRLVKSFFKQYEDRQ